MFHTERNVSLSMSIFLRGQVGWLEENANILTAPLARVANVAGWRRLTHGKQTNDPNELVLTWVFLRQETRLPRGNSSLRVL